MSHFVTRNFRSRFEELWQKSLSESPLQPDGGIDQLMELLADVLEVEQIQHVAVGKASAYLFDLTSLGFSGMGWNVLVVTKSPQSDEECRFQAEFLNEQKHATDSIGFCFQLFLETKRPEPNPYVGVMQQAVTLCRHDLERILESRIPRMAFAAIVREQTPVARLCPFNTNQEAAGAMFYGRRAELELLVEDFTQCVAVHGARRIGKTSLLKQASRVLRTRFHHDPRRVFYFNCLTWSGYQHACQMLAHKIDPRREMRLDRSGKNIEYLLERCSHGGKRPLLLFFDEVDRLIELDAINDWRFFSLLAAAKDAGQVRFVLAGYRSVGRLVYGDRSRRLNPQSGTVDRIHSVETPLLLQVASLSLGPLSRREADGLLSDPLRLANIEIESEAALQERVWRLTSGYPFLVQFIGQHLYRRAAERGRLVHEDVDGVEQGRELGEFLETHFIENTTQDGFPVIPERCCALLLAHSRAASWTEQDFWEGCRQHNVELGRDSLATVHRAIRNLVDSQILTAIGSRYEFAFPVMRQVLIGCCPNIALAIRALQEV